MSRKFILIISIVLMGTKIYAQTSGNFSVHIRPGADLPLGEKSSLFVEDSLYKLGASTTLAGQYNFSKPAFLFTEGLLNIGVHPTQAQEFLTLTSAGLGLGYDLRLADRISLQLSAQGGASIGIFGSNDPAGNPFLGASLAATWDMTPGLALSTGSTYRYHLGWNESAASYTYLYQGLNFWAGVILRIKPDSGRQKLSVIDINAQPLFPVFFGYYEKNPFGTLTFQNLENSAISNVDVYFNVSEYMEQPMLTASIPSLGRNKSAEVPLTALFTGRLMNLTESTKISSEVRIDYTYLGKRFSYTHPLTVTILDRNSMTWDDDRKAASFVTPRDPTVLIFSKNTAGIIRDQGNNPLSLNFRIAMGLFETMRLYGLNYVIDPQSSFIEASQDEIGRASCRERV